MAFAPGCMKKQERERAFRSYRVQLLLTISNSVTSRAKC